MGGYFFMRKLLLLPAIFGIGLFYQNKSGVAALIDNGEWTAALLYIGAGVIGAVCAIVALESMTNK